MDLDGLENRLFLTVKEAATACGCSSSTIGGEQVISDSYGESLDGFCVECPQCSTVYAETSVRYRLRGGCCDFCECDLFKELHDSDRKPKTSLSPTA
jgi:hypothetical protein